MFIKSIGLFIMTYCLFITVVIYGGLPTFILLLISSFTNRKLYIYWRCFITSLITKFVGIILEFVYNIKIVLYGDRITDNKTLIICNHPSVLDFIFFTLLYLRFNSLQYIKTVGKEAVKYMPLIGHYFQFANHIFVKRNWKEDQLSLKKSLEYTKKDNYNFIILPEGFVIDEDKIKESHEFSKERGLEKYNNILHPRIKGFELCFQELKEDIDHVYDLTLGLVGNSTYYTESCLFTGNLPKELHFHIKKIKTEDIEPEKFLKDSFKTKEQMMEKFKLTRSFGTPYNIKHCIYENWLVVLFWICNIILVSEFLFTSIFFRTYVLMIVGIYSILTYYGGIDGLEKYLLD